MYTENSIDYSYNYVQFLENLKDSLMEKLMKSDPKFTSKDVKDIKDLYLGQTNQIIRESIELKTKVLQVFSSIYKIKSQQAAHAFWEQILPHVPHVVESN